MRPAIGGESHTSPFTEAAGDDQLVVTDAGDGAAPAFGEMRL